MLAGLGCERLSRLEADATPSPVWDDIGALSSTSTLGSSEPPGDNVDCNRRRVNEADLK